MSATSDLSAIEPREVEVLVRGALAKAAREWGRSDLENIALDADLFEMIDSFAVVELLLETEADLEAAIGRYVPLADEQVMDADKSPLRSFKRWVDHVAAAANG